MRTTPVRTKPAARRIWVRLLMWDIGLRAKVLQGDPDVWLPEPLTPNPGSPWEAARALEPALEQAGHRHVVPMVEAEAKLRLETAHDYFHGMRAAARTRSAYSLSCAEQGVPSRLALSPHGCSTPMPARPSSS